MTLSSPQNPLLKKVRQAVESGRALDNGSVVAEGPHLVNEAIHSRWQVRQILATSDAIQRHSPLFREIALRDIETIEVAAAAFRSMAATEHSQGIIALLEPRTWLWTDLMESGAPLVILDGIQDPGNAGAIIRSAEAFGAAGAIFVEGSVRIANPKLLRASAGSIFRLPFIETVPPLEVVQQLQRARIDLYALVADGKYSLLSVQLQRQFALIVGNEGAGVGSEFMAAARSLSIPTAGVESLNAAVACSIALFEAARQRVPATPTPL